jgi:hypothetical protein
MGKETSAFYTRVLAHHCFKPQRVSEIYSVAYAAVYSLDNSVIASVIYEDMPSIQADIIGSFNVNTSVLTKSNYIVYKLSDVHERV